MGNINHFVFNKNSVRYVCHVIGEGKNKVRGARNHSIGIPFVGSRSMNGISPHGPRRFTFRETDKKID